MKETEVIDTLLSEEQRELSYDTPKLELKDMDETSQSLGGTFGVMDFAVGDAETTIDHWKTAQSFIGDTVSSILRSDTQQIKQCDLKQGKSTEEVCYTFYMLCCGTFAQCLRRNCVKLRTPKRDLFRFTR